MSIKRRGMEPSEAAQAYGVSVGMVNYRLSMTGFNRQFGQRRAAYPSDCHQALEPALRR